MFFSQLYSDGHMEAAMKLEMSVLDTAGEISLQQFLFLSWNAQKHFFQSSDKF